MKFNVLGIDATTLAPTSTQIEAATIEDAETLALEQGITSPQCSAVRGSGKKRTGKARSNRPNLWTLYATIPCILVPLTIIAFTSLWAALASQPNPEKTEDFAVLFNAVIILTAPTMLGLSIAILIYAKHSRIPAIAYLGAFIGMGLNGLTLSWLIGMIYLYILMH